MPKAFLHREQHIGVAARLDMDQPVRMKTREMEGRREEVAPAQAPENRSSVRARMPARKIVALASSASSGLPATSWSAPVIKPTARQPRVDGVDFERDNLVTRAHAFDSRDFGAKIGEDGGLAHDIIRPGGGSLRSLFVLCLGFSSQGTRSALLRRVEASCGMLRETAKSS